MMKISFYIDIQLMNFKILKCKLIYKYYKIVIRILLMFHLNQLIIVEMSPFVDVIDLLLRTLEFLDCGIL